MQIRKILQRLFIVTVFIPTIVLSSTLGSPNNPIRVGASEGRPFVHFDKGVAKGLSIDLWKIIAKEHGWHYRFIATGENVNEGIVSVKDKKIDVLIGPVSVTHKRMQWVSYSRPYYINQIALAIQSEQQSIFGIYKGVILKFTSPLLLLILLGFFLIANMLWFFEKRSSKEIPQTYTKGVFHSMWVFMVHFLRGGFFVVPKTTVGKVATMLWFFISLVLFLTFTATFTAYMTANLLTKRDPIENTQVLKNRPLAYVKGRIAGQFIEHTDARAVVENTLDDALKSLLNHEVFGVVEDHMILKNKIDAMGLSNIIISRFIFSNDEFAFAFPHNSPLITPSNRSIVYLQDSKFIHTLCQRYLADKAVDCQL